MASIPPKKLTGPIEFSYTPNVRETNAPEAWSKFEKYGVNNIENQDIFETRAQNQSSAEQWGHGALKMGVIASTTIADGIIGTVIGLGDMVIGEDGLEAKGSDFWNNPFSNAMADVNEWAEKAMPNYYTKAEQTDPFYKHMGANFWADKVLKNMGFMVGTVVDGMITGGASMYLTGAKAATRRLAKGLVGKALKGGDLLETEAQVISGIRKGQLPLSELEGILAKDARVIRNGNTVSQLTSSVLASGGEARIEAIGAMREFQSNMKNMYPEMSEEDINNQSLKLGNSVFGMNMAILSLSNYAQFRSAFSGAHAIESDAHRLIKGSLKDGYTTARATTKLGKAAQGTWNVAKSIGNPITEGLEETSQMAVTEAGEDFHHKKLDPNVRDGYNTYLGSLMKGIANTYGSNEGWENFAIGAITGMIGSPTFGMSKGDYKALGVLPMAGGVVGDIKKNFSRYKEADAMVEALNTASKSPGFMDMYNGMLTSYGYEKDIEEALKNGSKFDFENASTNQFINNVLTFSKAGKLEDFVDHINSFENNDVETLRELLHIKPENKEDQNNIKDPLQDMTDAQVKQYISSKVSKLGATIERISKIKKDLDTKFAGMDEGVKETLVRHFIAAEDADSRMNDLGQEVTKLLGEVSGAVVKEAYTELEDFKSRGINITSLLNRHNAIKGWQTRRDKQLDELSKELASASSDKVSEILDRYSKKLDSLMWEKMEGMNVPKNKQTNENRKKFESVKSKYNKYQKKRADLQAELDSGRNEERRVSIESEIKDITDKMAEAQKELSSIDTKALTDERSLLAMQEADIQKAYDLYNKIGDNPLQTNNEEFFEEFNSRLTKNLELLDELNKSVQTGVQKNPAIQNSLSEYLNSMQKLANRKVNFNQVYADGLTQNGNQTIKDSMVKAESDYLEAIAERERARYWDGRHVKNSFTDEKGVINLIGDDMYLTIGNGEKVKVEYNKEFYDTWKLISKDLKPEATPEAQKPGDKHDRVTNNGVDDKLHVTGNVVRYKGHEYLVYKTLNKKGEVKERYHLILRDGTVLPSGWESDKVEVELLESGKTMQLSGKVFKYAGEYALYSHVAISELSEKLLKQEEMSESEMQEADKITEEDEVTDAESLDFENDLKNKFKKPRPVFMMSISESYDEKTKKSKYKDHPVSDPALIAQIFEQHPDLVERMKDSRAEGKDLYIELEDVDENEDIKPNKDKSLRGYIKFPRPDSAPPVHVTLKTMSKSKGKYNKSRSFNVTNPDEIQAILKAKTKTKKGNFIVKHKGKSYFLTYTKYPKVNSVRGFYFYPKGRMMSDEKTIAETEFIQFKGWEKETDGKVEKVEAGFVIRDMKADNVKVIEERENAYIVEVLLREKKVMLWVPKQEVKYALDVERGVLSNEAVSVDAREKRQRLQVGVKPEVETIIDTDPADNLWTPAKRTLQTLFSGLAGNAGEILEDNYVALNEDESQVRYGHFVSNTNLANKNFQVRIMTPQQVIGQEAWDKKRAGLSQKTNTRAAYSKDELDTALWAVFVDKVSGEFVNQEGKPITRSLADEGIYTSVPLPTLTSKQLDKDGKQKTKHIDGKYTPEQLEAHRKQYQLDYNALFAKVTDSKGEPISINVIGKSQGLAVNLIDNQTQTLEQYFGGTMPMDITIEICVTGSIHSHGIELTNVRQGFIYSIDKQSGNMIELQPRPLEAQEVEKIVNALKFYASTNKDNKHDSTIVNSEGETIRFTKLGTERDLTINDIIESTVMFGGTNNLSEHGRTLYDAETANHKTILAGLSEKKDNGPAIAAERARYDKAIQAIVNSTDKNTRKKNNIIKDPSKAFYFEQLESDKGVRHIVIGVKDDVPYRAPLSTDGKLTEGIEDRLKEFLSARFLQIDSQLLGKGEPKEYLHVENIDPETGKVDMHRYVVDKEKGNRGYLTYLLTHKSAPLRTRQAGKNNNQAHTSNSKGLEAPVRMGQYAMMEVSNTKPTEPVKPEKKSNTGSEGKDIRHIVITKDKEILHDFIIEVNKGSLISLESYGERTDTLLKAIRKTVANPSMNQEEESELGIIQNLGENPGIVVTIKSVKPEEAKEEAKEEVAEKVAEAVIEGEDVEQDFDYRHFRLATEHPGQFENISQARAWFNERFPNVDFHVTRRLIAGKAFGQFRDAAVYIYEHAEVGTTYHEAFHAVTHLFLSPTEREALYAEAKRTPGLKSKIQENIDSGMTERTAIEEALAEEFRDFIMNDGTASFSKTPEKKSFFTRLWNMIKAFFTGKTTSADIQTVFNRIDAGYYKDMRVKPSGVTLNRASKVIGTSPIFNTQEFTNWIMEGMDHFFFQSFIENYSEGTLKLFDKYSNSDSVKKAYDYIETEFRKHLEVNKDNVEKGVLPNKSKTRVSGLTYILDNWKVFTDLHSEHLSAYNLEVVDEDMLKSNVNEVEREGGGGNQYAYESIKYSAKMTSSKNIKLLLGSLPNTLPGVKPEYNILGFITPVDFGRTFNILVNKLQNTSSIGEVVSVLDSLRYDVPGIHELITKLRLDNFNTESFSGAEMTQLIQFAQTFGKNKNNFEIEIIGPDGQSNMQQSSVDSLKNIILNSWKSRAIRNATGEFKKYYKGTGDKLHYNVAEFNNIKTVKYEDVFKFFEILGITFDEKNKVNLDILTSTANGILSGIKKEATTFVFSTDNKHKESNNMEKLSNLAAEVSFDFVENGHFNIDGDMVFDHTLNNQLSNTVNRINKSTTRKELNKKLKFLDPSNNLFVAGSRVLAKMFDATGIKIRSLEVSIHEGIRVAEEGLAITFDKLSPADKLSAWIRNIHKGKYPLLRPSDNKMERFIEFGVLFDHADMETKAYIPQFIDYLADEILVGMDSDLDAYRPLKKEGEETTGILLSVFKDNKSELAKSYHTQFQKMRREGKSAAEIRGYLSGHSGDIGQIIEEHLRTLATSLKESLIENKLITVKDGVITNRALPFKDSNIHPSSLNQFAFQTIVNFAAGNIEQMKLLYGNPDMFEGVEKAFKRFSGPMGTKKLMMTDPKVNDFIETYMWRIDKAENLYDKISSPGYEKPIVRTLVVNDPTVISNHLDYYQRVLGYSENNSFEQNQEALSKASEYGTIRVTNGKESYLISQSEYMYKREYNIPIKGKISFTGMTEPDGFGYISIDEWREMIFRSGDWTYGKGSLEELYQWERYEQEEIPEIERVYIDPVSKERHTIKKSGLPVSNPVKLQHYGDLAEKGSPIGFYKLSVMPILPSVAKGRGLEKLMWKMMDEKIGLVTYKSSVKVGAKDNTGRNTSLYNSDGSLNLEISSSDTQDTYYDNWGIQLDTGFKVKETVPSGTQMAKHILNSIFNKGVAKNPDMARVGREYLRLTGERIIQGMGELAEKVGLVKDSDGNWDVSDFQKITDHLMKEARRSNMPDNIIDSIQLLKKRTGVDTLINRDAIEKLLASMADHNVIHIKRFGGGKYQGASTMFELDVRKTPYSDGVLSSSDLKFYRNEDGTLKAMEIYLPSYFKGKVSLGSIDPRLLECIGFRIPTQGFSSIDSIVIKDFLPDGAGELVIVPSEMIAKTGSDFDIDKLNIYLPNFFYKNGVPTYIEYGSEEHIKSGYDQYVKDTIEEVLSKVSLEHADYYTEEGGKFIKTVLQRIIKDLRKQESVFDSFDLGIEMENSANSVADGPTKRIMLMLADDFKNAEDGAVGIPNSYSTYRRKAIENRMSEISREILLHPDNQQQLLTPLFGASDLKKHAEYVRELKGLGSRDKTSWSAVMDPSFVLGIGNRFMTGKDAVGITALASTWHVLSQVHNMQINLAAKDVTISLPYNKVEGNDNAVLGDVIAVDDSNIAFSLSLWINAAVDAAKDPFMFDYNANPDTLGTILMLTTIGVPNRTLALFMNQPIIEDFIKAERANKSLIGIANKLNVKSNLLKKGIFEKYGKDTKNVAFTDELLTQVITANASGTMSSYQKSIQRQILKEFLSYREIANELRDAIQGTTFDTHSIGNTTSDLLFRLAMAEKSLQSDTFINYDVMMGVEGSDPLAVLTQDSQTFIGHYYKAASSIKDMYKQLFVSLRNPELANELDKFVSTLVGNDSVNREDMVKSIDKYRTDFITYLLMNRRYMDNGKISQSTLKHDKDRLFKGENSVPLRIQNIQDILIKSKREGVKSLTPEEDKVYRKYGNNEFIKLLEPVMNSANEFSFMKMSVSRMDALESNVITENWRALLEDGGGLGQDLMKFIIIQSGLQASPMNFIRYLPFEVYGDLIGNVLYAEEDVNKKLSNALSYEEYTQQFYINNYQDSTIMPTQYQWNRGRKNMPYYKVNILKKEWEKKSPKERSAARGEGRAIYEEVPAIFTAEGNRVLFKDTFKNFRTNKSLQSYGNTAILEITDELQANIDDAGKKVMATDLGKLPDFMKSLTSEQRELLRQYYISSNSINC